MLYFESKVNKFTSKYDLTEKLNVMIMSPYMTVKGQPTQLTSITILKGVLLVLTFISEHFPRSDFLTAVEIF